jgi:hypothetical protein
MIQVKLVQDCDAQSPREIDSLGTMVCAHGSYNLGDENGLDKLAEEIRGHSKYRESYEDDYDFSKAVHLFNLANKLDIFATTMPLYLYNHSGITISTSPFSCPWDSGQVGFIYVTKEEVKSEYGVKRITRKLVEKIEGYLEGEVETYDQYLRNDIYGFQIIEDGEEIDSCYGFYGSNVEENGMLENIDPKHHELAKQAEVEYA